MRSSIKVGDLANEVADVTVKRRLDVGEARGRISNSAKPGSPGSVPRDSAAA